jgi:hypothetical protein
MSAGEIQKAKRTRKPKLTRCQCGRVLTEERDLERLKCFHCHIAEVWGLATSRAIGILARAVQQAPTLQEGMELIYDALPTLTEPAHANT